MGRLSQWGRSKKKRSIAEECGGRGRQNRKQKPAGGWISGEYSLNMRRSPLTSPSHSAPHPLGQYRSCYLQPSQWHTPAWGQNTTTEDQLIKENNMNNKQKKKNDAHNFKSINSFEKKKRSRSTQIASEGNQYKNEKGDLDLLNKDT